MSNDKLDIRDVINKHKSERQVPVDDSNSAILGNMPEGFDKSQVLNSADGVEVETSEVKKAAPVAGGGISGGMAGGKLSAEQMAGIEEELMEIDSQAEAARQEFLKWNQLQKEQREKGEVPTKFEEVISPDGKIKPVEEVEAEKKAAETITDGAPKVEENKNAEEALVIIDKSGMGQVINFTDAEREKLEKVKKIKLQEIEAIDLKTIKSKRVKKADAETILKKVNTIRTTPIVLPISGFTCVMQGCSTFELIGLISTQDVSVEGMINKWSLIHSKIESTSLGDLDFNTFLNSVSQMEYEVFVYGILCATYPEEDTFPLTCPQCQTELEHKYLIRGMLQTEAMSERLIEHFKNAVDSSYTVESSKECFNNSLLNTSFVYELPESKYIFKIGIATAYSHIYESIAAIDQLDTKYARAAVLASTVDSVFVLDPEDNEYYEFDDIESIIKTIYSLNTIDIGILGAKIGELVDGMGFIFGLNDIKCRNPKCDHHEDMVEVDLDTILFHKYQQAINTTID